ncbi:MAG: O-antigen ligase family protein [Proteobacteria bacterium]|nr:O-antigen ligase family protein [Pseudomonadota bacterium]
MTKLIVIFVGGLGALALMLLHPVGPVMALFAISPFDAIPWYYFRHWGNAITYVPVLFFLIAVPLARWPEVFVGSRIQMAAAALLVALLVSHVMAVTFLGYGVFEAYARKATQFVLLGLIAYSFRDPRHTLLLVRVFCASMALYLVLSMSDFYLGNQILPISVKHEWGAEGALGVEYERYLGGKLRFRGAGIPVNRTAAWQIVPICMGIGWFMLARRLLDKGAAAVSVVVMVMTVFATASRSALLGIVVGAVVIMTLAFRFRPAQAVLAVLALGIIGGTVYFGVTTLGAEKVFGARLDEKSLPRAIQGRINRTLVGFEVWATSPIWGTGAGTFKRESDKLLTARHDTGGRGAHNSYTEVLAETGLIGFLPFMILLGLVARQFLISVKRDYPEVDFWRPYFFAGFLGHASAIIFNVYTWERTFWIAMAYSIVLERYQHAAARKARAARIAEGQAAGAEGDGGMSPEIAAFTRTS